MRYLRILAGLVVLVLGIAGLGWAAPSLDTPYPRPAKPAKAYRLGALITQLANPHFIGMAYGIEEEARALGASVILHDAGGYQFLDRQIGQMEDLIANKVDAILLVAVSGPGTVPVVAKAYAARIPVININVMTDNPHVAIRIRSDDKFLGRKEGELMAQVLGRKGNVVMLKAAAGASPFELRSAGFKEYLRANTSIKILGEQNSVNTPDQGLKLMEDFMQTFPQIDGVMCAADFLAIGAAQAIRAAGKGGKMKVITVDLQPDAEKLLRDGLLAGAIVQTAQIMGRWGVRAAINVLSGRTVPPQLYTPYFVVTKQNVDQVDFTLERGPVGWKP
jgi:ABC-type sugar transport system substrate-binding protein